MRRLLALLTVAAVAAVGALAWWWYDGRDERRADGLRDDVAALPGVVEVVDVDDLAEVRLAPEATPEQAAGVFDAAERYRQSFEDADLTGGVTVRSGAAYALVSEDGDQVDPGLLLAAGAWPAPNGVDLRLLLVDDGVWVTASSRETPAVTTLAWLAEQVATLDDQSLTPVVEASATDEVTATHARLLGSAADDPGTVLPLLASFGRLADLDPTATVVSADAWSLDVAVPVGGQVSATRARVDRALRAHPDLTVDQRQVGDSTRLRFATPGEVRRAGR